MSDERKSYELRPQQIEELRTLARTPGRAFDFWYDIAASLGIDPRTIIAYNYKFTALPLKHRKHWCWPEPLRCPKKPEQIGRGAW